MGENEESGISRKQAKYIVDAVVRVAVVIADAINIVITIVVFVLYFAAFLVSQLLIFCAEATGRNKQQNKTILTKLRHSLARFTHLAPHP